MVSRTEDNTVELLRAPIHESHRPAVHRLDPRFYPDTPFSHERQKILAQCDSGLKDIVRRFGRSKLLRVACDTQHELLEARTHRSQRKPLFTESGEAGKRHMVQRHSAD